MENELRAGPFDLAGADAQMRFVAREPIATPLGQRPALAAVPVKRHVERAKVFGIAAAFAARMRVVGRKDRADKGDQRDAVPSVGT
jgi:hypothetical protein